MSLERQRAVRPDPLSLGVHARLDAVSGAGEGVEIAGTSFAGYFVFELYE